MQVEFSQLKGKTLTRVAVTREDLDEPEANQIVFFCEDRSVYRQYHMQSCCENVGIHDVCGRWEDVIGRPILAAEESSFDNHARTRGERSRDPYVVGSDTWTFYKIDTAAGGVTVRWLGHSNGWYSESVRFETVELSFYEEFLRIEKRCMWEERETWQSYVDPDWRLGDRECGMQVMQNVHGNACLVVNMLARADYGFVYSRLEQLHRIFRKPDFTVLGYRDRSYVVTRDRAERDMHFTAGFPISSNYISTAATRDRSEEYSWLCAPWNEFAGPVTGGLELFLIDRKGRVSARFPSDTDPMSVPVLDAIAALIGPANS